MMSFSVREPNVATQPPKKPPAAKPGGTPAAPGRPGSGGPPLVDVPADRLIVRIAELEQEQHAALHRIDELTQAKISVEQALERLRAQKEQSEQVQQSTEKLQEELKHLLQRKDTEMAQLRQKIEEIKMRTRHDIALYKAERDAALALVEEQKHLGPVVIVPARNRWLEYIAISILVMLGCITLILLVLL